MPAQGPSVSELVESSLFDSLARPLRMQVCDSPPKGGFAGTRAAVPAKALQLEIPNSRPHNNLVDLDVAGRSRPSRNSKIVEPPGLPYCQR